MMEPVVAREPLTQFVTRLRSPRAQYLGRPVRADRAILPATRRLAYQRDGWMCIWCGRTDRLSLDHIIPWSAGGTSHSWNLRTLCVSCNSRRGTYKDIADFRLALPVTQVCCPCAGEPIPEDPIYCYCGACGMTSCTDDERFLL